MSRLILGIPMKWLLALLATLVGGAAVVGTGAVVVVLAVVQGDDALPPVSELPVIEVVLEDPVDLPAVVTVPVTLPVVLTDTVPMTLPIVLTVTLPLTEPVVPTDTVPFTPTVELIDPGMAGLAFHPAHLNAGGKCSTVYQARGSLKNHGPISATNVVIEIDREIIGEEWLDKTKGDGGVEVTVTPSEPFDLDTSKPARFTVSVYTNDDWAQKAGKGDRIEVRLFVASQAGASDEERTEVVFVVRNQCKPDKPEKPAKPEKPEKPEKPVGPEKPVKPERPAKPEKPAKPKRDK